MNRNEGKTKENQVYYKPLETFWDIPWTRAAKVQHLKIGTKYLPNIEL